MKRIPIRGGNWNNGSNDGVAALNLNNRRSNANNNIGFRPALTHHRMPCVYGRTDSVQGKRSCAPSPCRENRYSPARPVYKKRTPPRGVFKDCMPKTINNIWPRVYDFENLHRAYKDASKGKRFRRASLRFKENLEEELITLQNELVWKTYRPGTPRLFYVSDPKKRLISAPPFRDRVVHHALVQIIEEHIDSRFIYDTHACRKGHGVQMAAKRLQSMLRGGYWYYKGDIKAFFPSISNDILKTKIRRIIADKNVLWLIDTIIDTQQGLPIGALTSQLFANLYLSSLDHLAKDNLGLKYIRYMDDFVVVDTSLPRLRKSVTAIKLHVATELRLTMNRKSGIGRGAVPFCGYRIRSSHILPRISTVKRAKRRLRKLAATCGPARVRESIMSFIGYMKHCATRRTVASTLDRIIIRGGSHD